MEIPEKETAFAKEKRIIVFLIYVLTFLHFFGSIAKYFIDYKSSYIGLIEIIFLYILFSLIIVFFVRDFKMQRNLNRVKEVIKKFFCREQILLLILFGALIVSCLGLGLINNIDYFSLNIDFITDLAIVILCVFTCGRYLSLNRKSKGFYIIIHIFLTGISALMLYVLYIAFTLKVVSTVSGKIGMIDYMNGALQLSIGTHPNTVGAYAGLILLICIYMSIKGKGVIRYIYILESCIHFIVLSLANSRGALFAFAIVFSCIIVLVTYYKLCKPKAFKRFLIALLIGFIIFGGVICFRKAVLVGFDAVTGMSKNISEAYQGNDFNDQYVIVRDMDLTWTHGRGPIWEGAVKLILENGKNIIFGVSPYYLSTLLGDCIGWDIGVYTHNQILEVGLATGVPSMIIFVVFLVLLGYRCIKIGLHQSKDDEWKKKIIPLIILYLVINNIMEAMLLYYNYFTGCTFFFLTGCIISISRKIDYEKIL